MLRNLIGRKKELSQLREYFTSDRSEFIAVYGRRRVGKTFLIRHAAKDAFTFFVTGVNNATKSVQLTNFAIAINKYFGGESVNVQSNWLMAFYELSKQIDSLPEGNKIIFIDELPWMDTPRAGFIAALENFWNSWASLRSDVKLVVCGSATSWIMNNLINSRGGLHNRLTHHIVLEPFSLRECEEYFSASGFNFTRKQISECYMVFGGVPYYLSLMDRGKSPAQNIDMLLFSENAPLKNEFNDLYRALYKNANKHIEVVTALSKRKSGMTRQDIVKETRSVDNSAFTTVLEELENCGFIRSYNPFGTKGLYNKFYQLIDFFTLFYFEFMKSNISGEGNFWSTMYNSPLHGTWCGLSFEMLGITHVKQIKKALGISGVRTSSCSWRSKKTSGGAQIDLLIDRMDDTINLCEMKYSQSEYEITGGYEEALRRKIGIFREETGSAKNIIMTLVTTYGVKHNSHYDVAQAIITLDDLFDAE
ncbi:MAG: ATP-binding protein [Muribaculaceae bacterium]